MSLRNGACNRIRPFSATLAAALAGSLLAQSPPAKTSAATAPADVVKLDLVVRDRHGRPVRDLRPEDLQITDNGAAAKIAGLSPAPGGSLYIALVFDDLDSVSARLARDAALEMLKQNPAGTPSFSVWRIHDRLDMVQGFTPDREAARRAVEIVTTVARGKGAEPGPKVSSAGVVAEIASSSERIIRDEHFRACPSRLLALTRHLAQSPGRKTILYFSDGIDITAATPEQLASMIGSANRLARPVGDRSHLVEQQKRVRVPQARPGKRPPHDKAAALALARRRENAGDLARVAREFHRIALSHDW